MPRFVFPFPHRRPDSYGGAGRIGSQDRLSCGAGFSICPDSAALLAAESPYFAPAAGLRTFVLPGSGHSGNLALNTRDYHAAVIDRMKAI